MKIVGEFLGLEKDKAIFDFFKRFYRHYFARLTCRVSFIRQAANLWAVKLKLFEHIAKQFADNVLVLDSLPIPVCRFVRAKGCKLFKGTAAYGKLLGNQTFYGFKLHVKINSVGMIQAFDLTPANVHDLHMVGELTCGDRGLLLADRAYFSEPLRQEILVNQGLELSVPTKYGQPSELDECQLRVRKRIRRLIETVGSQLTDSFKIKIKKIWARDLWHLTSRICRAPARAFALTSRKVLAHTFCVLFCLKEGIKPLSFSKLITV